MREYVQPKHQIWLTGPGAAAAVVPFIYHGKLKIFYVATEYLQVLRSTKMLEEVAIQEWLKDLHKNAEKEKLKKTLVIANCPTHPQI